MKNFILLLPVLALSFLLPSKSIAATAATQPVIGTILEVEGSASVTPPNGNKIAAAIKTPVHMRDLIVTGPKSKVFILFIDDTKMTLSENTQLTVDQYVFNPDDNSHNKGVYSIFAGSFEYVSGMIAHKANPDVTLNTSYGNIGIRGTKLWAGALQHGYGVHVDEGAVLVKNDAGSVLVPKGLGTNIESRKSKPSNAAPFPPEAMAFIQNTVFLAGEAMLLKRIQGFQGQQDLLRGQFKDFLKMPGNGMIPNGMPNGVPDMPFKSPKGGNSPKDIFKKFPF